MDWVKHNMKQYLTTALILLGISICALFGSQAEDLLREPRLTQILDSLSVYPELGVFCDHLSFDLPISEYYHSYIQFSFSPDSGTTKSIGTLSFHHNDKLVKVVDLYKIKLFELGISADRQYCIYKSNNIWNLYDVTGEIIRSYNSPGAGLMPYDVSHNGSIVFFKTLNRIGENTARKIVIIDSLSRVIFEQDYHAKVELAYSKDGKYLGILQKEETGTGAGKPPSKLTIYNENFQEIYEHLFSNYHNQGSIGRGWRTMTFIDDVLFLIVENKHSRFSYAALDVANQQMYWSTK